jgi:hypothetical protein
MLAGAAMALSSISVVLSSLMLKFYKPIELAEDPAFIEESQAYLEQNSLISEQSERSGGTS